MFLFLRCDVRSHLGLGCSCQTQVEMSVQMSHTWNIQRWAISGTYMDELYLKCTWMSYTWNVYGLAAIPEMYTDELYLKYTQRSYTRNIHRWAALLCELCKVSSYRNMHWFHSQGGVSSRGKESLVNSEGSTMITKLQKWNNQSYFLTCFCLYRLI